MFYSFFFLVLVGFAFGQSSSNKIIDLPGAPKNVSFAMYSGYIKVGEHNYFYWFVESAGNPSKDPVLLWLNGGPGCSSLGGLLSENGPFFPDKDGNLVENPYSWNKLANVLYLESPAGVGFSYCDSFLGCGRFDDDKTADDNYQVLVKWFQLYSSFAKNDFYIAGESYAGHYIPQLVERIYKNSTAYPNVPPQSNFKGFAAGNPLSDNKIDLEGPYLAQYLQTHGLIQLDDNDANDASGNYDPYDILVDVCDSSKIMDYIRFPHPFNKMQGWSEDIQTSKRYVPNPPACIESFLASYLNQDSVQKAIHAKQTRWQQCGGPSYTFGTASMVPLYQTFIDNTNYKIIVYSGDADTVLNFIATEQWILNMKLEVEEKWKPWYYHREGEGDQVGGWTVKFKGLRFITIKGAGHMVPFYQPAPALKLLETFLGDN